MNHQQVPSIQRDSLVEVRCGARDHNRTEDQTTDEHQCQPNRDHHCKHSPNPLRYMSAHGCRSIESEAIHLMI